MKTITMSLLACLSLFAGCQKEPLEPKYTPIFTHVPYSPCDTVSGVTQVEAPETRTQ